MKTPDWITADGTYIPLSEMASPHIMNVMVYIARGTGEYGPLVRAECSGFTNAEWLELCRSELLKRSRADQL
jgi:hypothetical protein